MGRKLFILLILIISLGSFALYKFSQPTSQMAPKVVIINRPTPKNQPSAEIKSITIFVPYWSLQENTANQSKYDRSVYFGITPTENGINKQEPGYNNLSKYNQLWQSGQKLLAVHMTNSDLNRSILADKDGKKKIITETVEVAKENNFSGIVLDLELFSLFNSQLPEQINSFISDFSRALKQNDLYFVQTLYGDTFYRHRPYDVRSIAEQVDEIMIMAYDFSKSKGEPGPNFPLEGKEKYGYDIKAMIGDFLTVVPREKLSVIFGMYGYDWTVDNKKRPVKPAEALTNNQIQQKYLDKCDGEKCTITKDKLSEETKIESLDNHIVWFENLKSTQVKQNYLQSQGIGSFAYWAFGYF